MQRKQAFSSSMSDATLEKPQLFLNKRPKTSLDRKTRYQDIEFHSLRLAILRIPITRVSDWLLLASNLRGSDSV
jgi:hypothetical protein